ncbi:MAG: SoxR reducing system RseC family protein, partial [Methylovulum sp.]|nr:SoxR reducing system RseC family protein [Methylovulum sp.]
VVVAMDEGLLLRSTLLVYCLPLVALFVGAGIADSLLGATRYADLWVALSAAISLSASLALVNRIQGAWFMGQLPTPTIIKKL